MTIFCFWKIRICVGAHKSNNFFRRIVSYHFRIRKAGGKPSTWLPPVGLAEQFHMRNFTTNKYKKAIEQQTITKCFTNAANIFNAPKIKKQKSQTRTNKYYVAKRQTTNRTDYTQIPKNKTNTIHITPHIKFALHRISATRTNQNIPTRNARQTPRKHNGINPKTFKKTECLPKSATNQKQYHGCA